jgi:flagellar protein FliJ
MTKNFNLAGRATGTPKADELQRTIRDLTGLAQALDRQIESEEARTKTSDPAHPAYSSFAVSARERLERLRASIAFFQAELRAASNDSEPRSSEVSSE